MHDLPLHCPKDIGIFASTGWEPDVNTAWTRKTDHILKDYIIHLQDGRTQFFHRWTFYETRNFLLSIYLQR